ncbi:MAG TPA: 2-hydroxyacyl-CoA dehydratase family protein [Syntrophorhabdaceae bacterium]|jgi:bcr-type benzoyl-CoA reductase subunit C
MTQLNGNGLALADAYYSAYGSRARELKAEGRKVIGYLSALAPVEIMTAAGLVPLRLKGYPEEPITRADVHMETIVCPFVRNVFDAVLKGKYDFLDGMVLPHQCDSMDRTNDVWSYTLKLPYWHFLNVPHLSDGPSVEFMLSILRLFVGSLEKLTGNRVGNELIALAVKAHNENRRLMRRLYDLRKTNPPLISGEEMTKVQVGAMSLPVLESSSLIEAVIHEVVQRKPPHGNGGKRIMIVGDQVDTAAIAHTIEGAGAWLVMDDISIGAKLCRSEIDTTPDPLQGLAEHYLRHVNLPTTYVAAGKTYGENTDARFGHLKQDIHDFKVDGVVLLINKYCDPYGFEVPAIKAYIESAGASVLYLEYEYANSTLPRLETRIGAFLEMIS